LSAVNGTMDDMNDLFISPGPADSQREISDCPRILRCRQPRGTGLAPRRLPKLFRIYRFDRSSGWPKYQDRRVRS